MQGTIVNGITLTRGDSHVLNSGDIVTVVERSFRFEHATALPAEAVEPEAADMIHFTPAKVEEDSRTAQETPSRPAPGTPTKASLSTTSKTSTPVRTLIKSTGNTTPTKVTGTPSKPSTESKVIMTSGIVGSPMRTMKLMGSPMRISTPVKPEQIGELVNEFSPGSTNGTPRRLSKRQQSQSPHSQPSLFEVTPVKQLEQIPSLAPREGSTVSRFNVSEVPPTKTALSSTELTSDSPGRGGTPKVTSTITNNSDEQPSPQLMGLVTPPPPLTPLFG